jgi:hypothetical protein
MRVLSLCCVGVYTPPHGLYWRHNTGFRYVIHPSLSLCTCLPCGFPSLPSKPEGYSYVGPWHNIIFKISSRHAFLSFVLVHRKTRSESLAKCCVSKYEWACVLLVLLWFCWPWCRPGCVVLVSYIEKCKSCKGGVFKHTYVVIFTYFWY